MYKHSHCYCCFLQDLCLTRPFLIYRAPLVLFLSPPTLAYVFSKQKLHCDLVQYKLRRLMCEMFVSRITALKVSKQPPSCTWCNLESVPLVPVRYRHSSDASVPNLCFYSAYIWPKVCLYCHRSLVLHAADINDFLWMNSCHDYYHEVNMIQWTKEPYQLNGGPSVPHSGWLLS